MKLTLNFDDVDLTGPEPIPAGVYEARVDTSETEVKKSQNGNDYITLTYVIEKHPEYAGRKVFENYTLTKKSLWKLGRALRALGALGPLDKPLSPGTVVVDFRSIHGKTCRVKVSQEDYNGRIRNRVDEVMPAESEATAGGLFKKKISF